MDDQTGDTGLLLACRLGLAKVVDVCLRAGARNDPHPAFGQTALQAAVAGGHAECVKRILDEAALSQADTSADERRLRSCRSSPCPSRATLPLRDARSTHAAPPVASSAAARMPRPPKPPVIAYTPGASA